MRAFGALRVRAAGSLGRAARLSTLEKGLQHAARARIPGFRAAHDISCAFSTQASSKNAFVSRYYELEDRNEVRAFLGRKALAFRESDSHFVVKECPFCHATRGRADNLFKLYVHKSKGVYLCHRCGASGSWFEFKQKVIGPPRPSVHRYRHH